MQFCAMCGLHFLIPGRLNKSSNNDSEFKNK